jgi:hypothetical protein
MPTENGGMPELLATLVQLLFLKTCSADNSLFRIFFCFIFFTPLMIGYGILIFIHWSLHEFQM